MTPRCIGAEELSRIPRGAVPREDRKPTVADLERADRRRARMLCALGELFAGGALLYALMWLACWP